jgi:carboxymethylenebutenolidase
MRRKKASDFDPEVLKLFDKYVHGVISRRGFLLGAAKYAAGGVTATALLDALNPKFAEAQQVKTDDSRIDARFLEYASPEGNGRARAYVVRPSKAAARIPGVLVVHENRGLNPHIADIARRLALDGFLAFAPDALFPLGGYPGGEDKARELFAKLDQAKARADFVAAAHHLRTLPDCSGKMGAVGFCYGGGVVNMLATRLPELGAAVPFYGNQPPAADVPKIRAPLLIHYAEHDDRINAGRAAYEMALKAANVRFESYIYPGTQHGFNNDTTPRYDESAARLAWQRTIDFFNANLRAG